ncbi:proton-conducting transporter membrane subunit [Dethiosulfovibrio faecalis]|uniref:proton-conducting transporter transmembrane domain-containing protein n=1 Tax=Dethiosulfovibrio faecalis TaxID=2720018 RepID=UPI001F3E4505
MEFLLLGSVALYFLSALGSLSFGRRSPGGWIVPLSSVLSSLMAVLPLVSVLACGSILDFRVPWGFPVGSFHVRMDMLSGWFVLILSLVSPAVALYGRGYLSNRGETVRGSWTGFFLQMLSGGIFMVLISYDGILFLLSWEIMSMAAFFLVMFDHPREENRRAGWIYLVATHLGTAFLFFMFFLLGAKAGSFDLDSLLGLGGMANLVFPLAIVGFGAKAGFLGLHLWLPEAHPAAPSHGSALMSGVMVKTGIYGVLRVLAMAQEWPQWWGWLLLILGVASGLGGVVHSVVQRDLKRLLAFCTVENMGIILIGLGIGVLGTGYDRSVGVIAMGGALLHCLNHSLFKAGLFMAAGSVIKTAGTGDMDWLGGLCRTMPRTGTAFLVLCLSVCGLPPFNGFVGEFLIYTASYLTVVPGAMSSVGLRIGGFVAISSLALVGGLAAMAFLKAYGMVFLGFSRSDGAAKADPGSDMVVPMSSLTILCLVLGLAGSASILMAGSVATAVHPLDLSLGSLTPLAEVSKAYLNVSFISFVLFGAGFWLWRLRARLQRDRTVSLGPVWGCGYGNPSARMQYTGSSFSQPVFAAFRSFLRSEVAGSLPEGYFPGPSIFHADTSGVFHRYFYGPLFGTVMKVVGEARKLHHGGTHLYVFYVFAALVAVLLWSLR